MKAIDKKITEFKHEIYELAEEFTRNRMFGDADLDPTIQFCKKLWRNGFENISIDTVKDDDKNLSRTYIMTASKTHMNDCMEAYIHVTYSFRTISHEQYDMNVIVANVVTL